MVDAGYSRPSAPRAEQSLALSKLVSGWKEGSLSSHAEGELWRTVLRIASDYVRMKFRYLSEHDRDDISQEAVRNLLSADLSIRDPNATTAYIQACARNAAIDFLCRSKSRRERAPTSALPDECVIVDKRIPEPSTEVEVADLRSVLRECACKLPPHLAETCQAYLDNHIPSVDTLACLLKIPVGTVKSRLYEIRTLLRKMLDTLV